MVGLVICGMFFPIWLEEGDQALILSFDGAAVGFVHGRIITALSKMAEDGSRWTTSRVRA